MTYSQIDCSVHAERCFFGRESLASAEYIIFVSIAGLLMADVAQRLLAAQGRVVWLTHREEMRGQVARNHLTGVHKDVCGEEAKQVHT